MSTATRVPETHELEGDDALNALRRRGQAGWLRTRSSASAPLTACGSRGQPRTAERLPDIGSPQAC